MPCGSFEIDDLEAAGVPDVLIIKAISTNITKSLRQKNTKAFEGKSLKDIAGEYAGKHGLTLIGDVKDQKFSRKTQKNETDLNFLRRVAEEYGQVFKVVDGKLVFFELETLDAKNTVHQLDRKQINRYSFRNKSDQVFKACEVSYHCPKTKKMIKSTVTADGDKKGDILKITERCENPAQAKMKAQAALKRTNDLKTEGTITIDGDNLFVSGSNVEITGFGVYSGKYAIKVSRHSLTRDSAYDTELEVRKIA